VTTDQAFDRVERMAAPGVMSGDIIKVTGSVPKEVHDVNKQGDKIQITFVDGTYRIVHINEVVSIYFD
jgi:hypothetical protein